MNGRWNRMMVKERGKTGHCLPSRSAAPERLESRRLLAFDPSPQAQEMLEHVNRMRLNPQAEQQVIFTSINPLTARDADANSAVRYFNDPTAAQVQADWPQLRPVAPLAWSESLSVAAESHSRQIIQFDTQSHQLPGEPALPDRVIGAGYTGISTVGENVYAYAKNVFNAHSAFVIDWGNPGRGHRSNIMNASYRDFGVGLVADDSSATRAGPLVVTQDFGNKFTYGNSFMLGVVYADQNQNQRYDAGEGIGGATVQISGPSGTFTTTTMSAGGYQIRVPAGTYTVTASGGPLTAVQRMTNVRVASDNVKVDFDGHSTQPGNVPSPPSSVVGSPNDAKVALAWVAPSTDGGAAITDYVVQYSEDNGGSWTTFADGTTTATSALVTGLVNGRNYVFRVAAVNSVGAGAFSPVSGVVTPTAGSSPSVTVPGPSTDVAGVAGNRQVNLTWRAPAVVGSSPIVDYVVEYSGDSGVSWTAFSDGTTTGTAATVTGLSNGIGYLFRVAAVNASGVGSFSAVAGPVVPRDIPANDTRILVLPAFASEPRAGSVSVLSFTLQVIGDITVPIRIAYHTRDVSATAIRDYRPKAGTITLLPGDSQKRIAVSVDGDGKAERDEQFALVLNDASGQAIFVDPLSGAAARGATAVPATILDYDSRFFSVAAVPNPSSAGVTAKLVVSLNRLPGYGAVLPSLDAVPASYRALVGDSVRFSTRVSLRQGVRGRELAQAVFGSSAVNLGYFSGVGGTVSGTTTTLLQGPLPPANPSVPFTARLFDGVNARIGNAAVNVVSSRARATAFAARPPAIA